MKKNSPGKTNLREKDTLNVKNVVEKKDNEYYAKSNGRKIKIKTRSKDHRKDIKEFVLNYKK